MSRPFTHYDRWRVRYFAVRTFNERPRNRRWRRYVALTSLGKQPCPWKVAR